MKGPFVDGGAVSIPNEGVLLCGGLLGDRKSFIWSNKCFLMDFKRNKLKGRSYTNYIKWCLEDNTSDLSNIQ